MDIDKDFPVGNAAGWCKSVFEVEKLSRSAAAFIVVGSITVNPRTGNPGNTFDGNPVFCLNSLGLPNPGIESIEKTGPEMIKIARAAGKPIILSIAGFTPEEFWALSRHAQAIGFDGVEINIGCPNIVRGSERKPIISYRPDLVSQTLQHVVGAQNERNIFVSVKVSPMDPERMREISGVIMRYPVDAVVTQNTVPNCLDFDPDKRPIIDTPDHTGFAGGSGKQIFRQALGQVRQWRSLLPEDVAVWGVGGVDSGLDVRKMIWAGASVVQVGTSYFISGPKVFGDIAAQYVNFHD
jgi:dihydroorotate dehydrogenase (fumarate)